MSDFDRDLLAHAYRDYEAAVKAARALWLGAGEATLREAAADFLVHVRELRRSGSLSPAPSVTPASGEPTPRCPVCQSALRDQRSTKRGNQPDYKCSQRTCDGAVWLDRKRTNGSHP